MSKRKPRSKSKPDPKATGEPPPAAAGLTAAEAEAQTPAQAEPTPEPAPEPEPKAALEPKPVPASRPGPAAKPAPRAAAKPAPEPRAAPRPAPTPEPEPAEVIAEPPSAWQRLDLLVVIGALALLAGGVLAYRSRTAPQLIEFSQLGLSLSRPNSWLPPQPVPPVPSRLALAVGPGPGTARPRPTAGLPYHVIYQSPTDPLTRLEIQIDKRPTYNNLGGALALARVSRYGEVYWAAESDDETIRSRDWLRTRFRYAFKADDSDSPKVATGIEYATLNGGLVYVVTVHGSEQDAENLRKLVAPTLGVDANHPAATRKE